MGRTAARLRKAAHLLSHLTDDAVRRGAVRGVAPSTEHLPLLRRLSFRSVIDVGANRGQFVLAVLQARPTVTVLAIEPIDEAADVIEAIVGGRYDVHVRRAAAGSDAGERTLYLTKADDSSSLLAPTDAQVEGFPGTHVVGERRVPVSGLDSLAQGVVLPRPTLLKVDVQGSELDVIRGASQVLGEVDHVLMEVSFEEFYAGQPGGGTVLREMLARGFSLVGAYQPSVAPDGSVRQVDLLFESTRG